MRISDICSRKVVDVKAATPVSEAAKLMRKHHVGALVVVEQPNGERLPIGVLTDRDIVVSVLAAGIDPLSVTVGDVMSRNPATCGENEELFDAIETMRNRGVRRLPVVNDKGGLVGILAADDISSGLCTHLVELSRALTYEQVHEMQMRR